MNLFFSNLRYLFLGYYGMKMVDFYIDFLCDVMGSCCIFVDLIERGGRIKDDNCGLGCLNKKIEC